MAGSSCIVFACAIAFLSASLQPAPVSSQLDLNPAEKEMVYRVLESFSSQVQWRSLFPDHLCDSPPHGVVCEYFTGDNVTTVGNDDYVPHITEFSFGYVSDNNNYPPCDHDASVDPLLLSSFPRLRKLFFYKCFTGEKSSFPDFSSLLSLEELVFIENPSLVGSISSNISNLTSLRRLILTGTDVSGTIPDGFADLVGLEEVTLSRNKLTGDISISFAKLRKLKILDLSNNGFEGNVPESIGGLTELLKLDLSSNRFSGNMPDSFKGLKSLEFLDLSYNSLAEYGVPLFLGEMPSLKEVHLSGNFLGGQIPDIWEHLSGILGIGLSGMGLVGNIPASMGMFLTNASYIGLDSNRLEGTVPVEFGSLEAVNELNLGNNNLSGRVPFSAKFVRKIGQKLKLDGNPQLCVDDGLRSASLSKTSLAQLKLCKKPDIPRSANLSGVSCLLHASPHYPKLVFLAVLFILLSQ